MHDHVARLMHMLQADATGLSSSSPRSHLSRHIGRLSTRNSCWQPSPVAHSLHSKVTQMSDLLSLRHALLGPLHHQNEEQTHAGAHPVFWFGLCWDVAAGPGRAQLNRCAASMALLWRRCQELHEVSPRFLPYANKNCSPSPHSKVTSASCLRHDFQSTLRVLPSGHAPT